MALLLQAMLDDLQDCWLRDEPFCNVLCLRNHGLVAMFNAVGPSISPVNGREDRHVLHDNFINIPFLFLFWDCRFPCASWNRMSGLLQKFSKVLPC